MSVIRDDLAAILLILACIVGAFIAAAVIAEGGRAVIVTILRLVAS